MKRTISLTAIIFIFATSLHASVDDKFVEANNLYKVGEYEQAIDVYNSILAQGYISAPLYYNLGNAYFRTDNLAAAILNYERALKIEPLDKDVQQNLEYANSKTHDRFNKVPELFITKWFNAVLGWFTISQWGVATIILMVLVCVSVVVFLLANSYRIRQVSFYVGIVMLVLLVCSYVNANVLNNRMENLKYAIVMQPTAMVKSSPDENSADKFLVHEGCKVEIEDNVNNWCKVKLSDGNTGWVEDSSLENI